MNPVNITEITKRLTFQEVTSVTQDPLMLLVIVGIIWFVPLFLYLIIAGSVRARTSSGVKLKGSMLSKVTGWIPVFIWLIQAGLILIFLIFPVWLGSKI